MEWLKDVWRVLAEAQSKRAQVQQVSELDARALRDVGLNELANEERRRAAIRTAAFRMGCY